MQQNLTRREFLRIVTLSSVGLTIASCAPQIAAPTPITGSTIQSPSSPAATAQSAESSSTSSQSNAASSKNPKAQSASVNNSDFSANIILGRPTATSITANLIPASAMSIYYEYGTTSGVYTSQTSPQNVSANTPIETLIGGLQANTQYYYRLRTNGNPGVEHSFMTQRAPGATFTFDIQGDSHPERLGKEFSPDLYPITLRNAAADQPDFYMTIGDDFSVDTLKSVNADTVKALYLTQRQWLGQVGAPLFLINGNHEQAAMANLNGTVNNVAVWAQTARNALYPQPAPDNFYSGDADQTQFVGSLRDYYAWTWGDALFVVLDQYWHSPVTVDNQFGVDRDQKAKRDLWQVTIGDAQYQWFKRTLETSPAKYKFVFSHHVLGTQRGGIDVANQYEWGDARNLAAHRPGWSKTIHQVMVDNHVNIYFQGHDHIFVKQELDGVIYQTLPEPGDPNYALNNAESYKSGDKLPSTGHVRVTVSPTQVKVDYVRAYLPKDEGTGKKNGEVAYSYTVASKI